jgi:hypothetical protein
MIEAAAMEHPEVALSDLVRTLFEVSRSWYYERSPPKRRDRPGRMSHSGMP